MDDRAYIRLRLCIYYTLRPPDLGQLSAQLVEQLYPWQTSNQRFTQVLCAGIADALYRRDAAGARRAAW